MESRKDAIPAAGSPCTWVNLREALAHFGSFAGSTQSQHHIKPLHWYVACRLVVEGGFHPDDVTPRPPFRVVVRKGITHLEFDPSAASGAETVVLGGLKTKKVDVVVKKNSLGPVVAVSCKGMTGAFRNLTNRMEETIGECTNLHITYPAMVFGFMFVLRANRMAAEEAVVAVSEGAAPARTILKNDVSVSKDGGPVESVVRFYSALRQLAGRDGIREDPSRYEAVALGMVEANGDVLSEFPPPESPLRLEGFFRTLYAQYDQRFVFSAPDLGALTRRHSWAQESHALSDSAMFGSSVPEMDYEARMAEE